MKKSRWPVAASFVFFSMLSARADALWTTCKAPNEFTVIPAEYSGGTKNKDRSPKTFAWDLSSVKAIMLNPEGRSAYFSPDAPNQDENQIIMTDLLGTFSSPQIIYEDSLDLDGKSVKRLMITIPAGSRIWAMCDRQTRKCLAGKILPPENGKITITDVGSISPKKGNAKLKEVKSTSDANH